MTPTKHGLSLSASQPYGRYGSEDTLVSKLILTILLISLITLSSCSTISNLTPKSLAKQTQRTVEQVELYSNTVFSEIQDNIDMVSDLKDKVQDARIEGKILFLDEIIKDLQKVTESYEKLSNEHDNIRQSLLRKIDTIQTMQEVVDKEVTNLKDKRLDYIQQLQTATDPDPEIARTRQEALSQAMIYLDTQIMLWQDFNSIEDNIVDEMVNVQETIDRFLNVIDSSAILFREGLNLLVLQRDINDALSLFTQDLPRMEQLSSDMEKSWANLDYLVETLTSISATELIR